jgi:hypothetical protein
MEHVSIAIDLGNSQTRYSILYKGAWVDRTASNRFIHLMPGYEVPVEYQNDKSLIFRYDELSYGNGDIVGREFSHSAVKPTAIKSKTEQVCSMLSINVILINTFKYFAEKWNKPITALDLAFDIFVLLPASEHAKSANVIASKIQNITSIDILSPMKVQRSVNISSVKVLAEGVAAYMGAMYEFTPTGEMVEREVNQKFLTGETLVIDVGAGTTDISLIKDSSVVLNSKESFREGGNRVEADCKNIIHTDFDYYPSDEAIRGILENGILLKGAKEINAEKYLNTAKRDFGMRLNNFLLEYLERNNVELRDLKGLLVAGGGALPTYRDGQKVSPAMCDVLIELISEVTDSVELVDTTGCNPRTLNIDGLKLFCMFS